MAQSVGYPRSAAQNEELFSNETFETLEEFDCVGAPVDFATGEMLFREGQSCERVYVISSGRVKLWTNCREGRKHIVAISRSGEVLGLAAALAEGVYEATAEATGNCRVRVIRRESVIKLLEANPAACMRAMQAVIRDQSSLWLNLRRLSLPTSASGRVAGLLLDWVRKQTPAESAQGRCMIPLTHREIASMSATTRESVTRIITRLKHEKVISVRGAALTVLKPQALEKFCGL
jgi:CRP/FNR family transcriptional regulator, cyclic AMP receptor protein